MFIEHFLWGYAVDIEGGVKVFVDASASFNLVRDADGPVASFVLE